MKLLNYCEPLYERALNMSYDLSPQNNFVLQFAILLAVLAAFILAKQRKFVVHGSLMLLALILNAVSLVLKMVPSLFTLAEAVAYYPLSLTVVTVAHAIIGTLAEVLGVWFVVSWRVRSSPDNCFGKKRKMRATLVLWMGSFLLGVWVYVLWYPGGFPI